MSLLSEYSTTLRTIKRGKLALLSCAAARLRSDRRQNSGIQRAQEVGEEEARGREFTQLEERDASPVALVVAEAETITRPKKQQRRPEEIGRKGEMTGDAL